jgi:hypothetical protein
VARLQIDWPSGLRQSFENIPAGQRIEITEGKNSVRSLVKFRPAATALQGIARFLQS